MFETDRVRGIALTFVAIVVMSTALAAKTKWTGAADTDWFNSSNWDNGVPDANEDAEIPSGQPRYPVLTANATTKKLDIKSGATLDIGSFQVRIFKDLIVEDTDALSATSSGLLLFDGSEDASINGPFDFAGNIEANKSGGKKVEFKDDVSMNSLLVSGNSEVKLGDSNNITVNGDLEVESGEELDRDKATLTVVGDVTIDGTFNDTDNTGGTTVGGDWTQSGTFETGDQTVTFNGGGTQVVTTTGTSDFNNVTLTNNTTVQFATDVDIDGTLTIGAGTTVDADGDLDLTGGATTFTGAGTLNIGDTVTSLGTFTASTGTVVYDDMSTDQTVLDLNYNNLEIDKGSFTATVSGSPSVNGTLDVTSGTLDISSSGALDVDGAVTVDGTLSLTNGGDLELGTSLDINSGGTLQSSGATNSTIDRTGSADYTITVASGGTVDINGLNITNIESTGLTLNDGAIVENIRDIDFTSIDPDDDGANDAFLRILELGAENYRLINLTFDASTTYNICTVPGSSVDVRMINPGGAAGTSAFEKEGVAGAIDWPLFSREWVGGDAGNETSWGTADNWSPAGVPNNGDDVYIPNTANDPILDVDGTALLILVDTSATLTIDTDLDLELEELLLVDAGATFAMTDGTLIFSGSTAQGINDTGGAAITVNNLTLNSSSTLTSSVDLNIAGNLTVTAGEFRVASLTHTVTGATDVNGTLSLTTGTLDANGSFDATGGSVTFSGAGRLELGGAVTSLGTFTANSSTVEYDDTASNRNIANVTYNNLEIGATGRVASATTGLTVNGDLIVSSGTFAVGSNTITVGDSVDVDGTLTVSTGTVDVASEFDATGGAVTFTGAGRLELAGDVTSLGTFTESTSTVDLDNTSSNQTLPPDTYYNLEIAKSSVTATVAGALTVTNTLSMTSGNLDVNGAFNATGAAVTFAGSGKLSLGGAVTSLGTFTAGSGTVEYDDTSAGQTIAPVTYNDLEIDNGGQVALTGGDITVSDDVDITSGELEIDDGDTLRVDDDVSVSGILDVEPQSSLTLAAATSLVVGNGGEFEAVGDASNVTFVTASDTATPGRYSFEVQAGGIIDVRYTNFRYMNSSGIRITDNGSVTALTQFSDVLFDNGPAGGTYLSIVDNDNAVSFADVNFFDTNGSATNVATTNATATITFSTYGGDLGGPSFEDDNGGGTVTPGFVVWGTMTPARLLHFDAMRGRRGVDLQWETAAEWNCAGFAVERWVSSTTSRGGQFVPVGRPIKAAGNSGLGARYQLDDPATRGSAPALYRLIEIDIHGNRTVLGKTRSLPTRRAAVTSAASPQGTSAVSVSAATAPSPALHSLQQVVLETDERGIVRVRYSQLSRAGFDVSADPRQFGLERGGEAWPIWIHGESDGIFDPSDSIVFFAPGIDSLDTRVDAYFLTTQQAQPARMVAVSPQGSTMTTTTRVRTRQTFEESRLFVASRLDDALGEPWFWDFLQGGQTLTVDVDCDAPDASRIAQLTVYLNGFTDKPESSTDHQTTIRWNGLTIGTMTASRDGAYQQTFQLPAGAIVDGVNSVELEHASLGGLEIAYLDRIDLDYVRESSSRHDQISIPLVGTTPFRVDGFSTPDVVGVVVEESGSQRAGIRQPVSMQFIDRSQVFTSGSTFGFDVAPRQRPSTLHASSVARLLTPARIRPVTALTPQTRGRVDALIIAPEILRSTVQRLAALRRSQGHRVVVVTIESIYDAMDFGRATREAVTSFIRQVYRGNQGRPFSVLLVGDATYDPKGYSGAQPRQLIPTQFVETMTIQAASDDGFVDLDGDQRPDLPIGRLPVATSSELNAVIDKLTRRAGQRSSSASCAFISDRFGEFEWLTLELESVLGANWQTSLVGGPTRTPVQVRDDIEQAWLQSPSIVAYTGHGSRITWGLTTVLERSDVAQLVSPGPLPIVIALNCLSAYFQQTTSPSIGELMVTEPNAGAVAYWGPTALTTTLVQVTLGQTFSSEISRSGTTLGEAILRAKRALPQTRAGLEASRTWILLGDPLTRP